ncbi:hypothetical protein AHAS_Ahas18G0081700 [Arachis hypogaea]
MLWFSLEQEPIGIGSNSIDSLVTEHDRAATVTEQQRKQSVTTLSLKRPREKRYSGEIERGRRRDQPGSSTEALRSSTEALRMELEKEGGRGSSTEA